MSATGRRGRRVRAMRPVAALVVGLTTAAVVASAAVAGGGGGPGASATDPTTAGAAGPGDWSAADAPPADDGGVSGPGVPGAVDGDVPGAASDEDTATRSTTEVDDLGGGIRVPPSLLDRRLSAGVLSMTPAVPTDQRIGDPAGAACATGEERPVVDTTTPTLSARVVILRASHVAGFELASAASPADVVWSSGWVSPSADGGRYAVELPAELLSENAGAYAWRVRSGDGVQTSAWSSWCEFAVDVAPEVPVISPVTDRMEAVYVAGVEPSGAVGAEGRFLLTPAGSSDVVAYEVDFGDATAPATVEAAADGTATVSFRPGEAGEAVLGVTAVDRAGHRSNSATHAFVVADTTYTPGAPHVPWSLMLADPYRPSCVVGDGRTVINSTTPQLSAIGTHAKGGNVEMRFQVAPVDDPGSPVWTSTWLAGQASGQRSYFRVPAGALPAGASYSWRAEARQNGIASGWSPRCEFEVDVVGPVKPTMTPITEGVETVFYDGVESGEIGKEGRFLLATEAGDVASFRVSIHAGATTTLPAGPDGTATFSYTPSNWYTVRVTVHAIDRAGNLSVATEYTIEPDDTP